MPATIVLNQSNLVTSDGFKNTLVYNFPNSVTFSNHEIAVQSISLYYSWANISASLGNNTFTYSWTVGGVLTNYNVIIPDGLYEISAINSYMQYRMIQNGHYLINASAQNVYYAEMLVNANRYAIQVNTFPVPIALPVGWTAPVANPATGALAFAGYPAVATSPTLVFPANFSNIIGFTAGYTTPVSAVLNQSFFSTIAPQVQPNPTAYVNITGISNKYSAPSTIIYSVSPSVGFGSLIIDKPPEFAYNKLLGGSYNQLRINITGSNGALLPILDGNMTILLTIREGADAGKV